MQRNLPKKEKKPIGNIVASNRLFVSDFIVKVGIKGLRQDGSLFSLPVVKVGNQYSIMRKSDLDEWLYKMYDRLDNMEKE